MTNPTLTISVEKRGDRYVIVRKGKVEASFETLGEAQDFARGFADDMRWLASNR